MRRGRTLLKRTAIGAVIVGALASVALSWGAESAPFLSLRAYDPAGEVPADVDAEFPLGAGLGPERPASEGPACSSTRPVCLHGARGTPAIDMGLGVLERAYDAVVLALGAPPPLPDSAGPTPGLDLYLVPGDGALSVYADVGVGRGDSRPAYCVASGALLSAPTAVRCVAEAASFRLDAAETPALRRALGTYFAWLALGPDAESLDAVDRAQVNPQIGLVRRDIHPLSDAGALFWHHLEDDYGSGRPGELVLSLFAQSRRAAPSGEREWHNEPDVLDVLRVSLGSDLTKFADLAIEFAVARLFLGDRADGTHAPNGEWLGSFGRVRFDWTLDFDGLPRNVAAARPLEPLGSAYVWLDARTMKDGTELVASLSWEAPVRFRWAIVAIDPEGRELRRFDVPFFERGTQVERTVLKPEGAVGFAFVGMNLGGVHADYPFDPDHEPWEPHGYELYVVAP